MNRWFIDFIRMHLELINIEFEQACDDPSMEFRIRMNVLNGRTENGIKRTSISKSVSLYDIMNNDKLSDILEKMFAECVGGEA